MQLLLVEDNARLRASLTRGLRACGLSLDAVDTGNAALQRLSARSCDAVILDLGLPDLDGLDVLVAARHMGVVAPVLVLSARDSVVERVHALDRGADDYLVKPFEFTELVARLRALVRRASSPRWAPLELGDLQLDAEQPLARVGKRSVALSRREHALLEHLMRHAGQIAKRRDILSNVFGCTGDPGTNVIDVHIAHLRRKLEGANVHVETVRGLGYRLQLMAASSDAAPDA